MEITIDDVKLVQIWPSLSKIPGWTIWFTYDKFEYSVIIPIDNIEEEIYKARQKALEAFKKIMEK